MPDPEVLRYAAFTTRPDGGNPAGVVLDAGELDDAEMQRIAAEVDFAETAFVTGETSDGARSIRYFSPIAEVPFCGHATVATAIALAERSGADGDDTITFDTITFDTITFDTVTFDTVTFDTPVGRVEITTSRDADGVRAAFTSIPPTVTALADDDRAAILELLGLTRDALDPDLPPRIANAGNPHPIIALADRDEFDAFRFNAHEVRALMDARGWPATIAVVHRAASDRFIARNLFPVGRITEDPATGSAAAALGAYLRELRAVPVPDRVIIEQGAHVGRPGLLTVDIPESGGLIVSGHAVLMD